MLIMSFLATVDWFWMLDESFWSPVFWFEMLIVSFRGVVDSYWMLNKWIVTIVDRTDSAIQSNNLIFRSSAGTR